MIELLGFALEKTLINTFPIVLGILLFRYALKAFLKNFKQRTAVYATLGACAGIVAYALYDIPARSFETPEIITLAVSMWLYSGLLIFLGTGIRRLIKRSPKNEA